MQGDYLSFLPSQLITPETDGLVPLPIDAPRTHPDISMIFQDGALEKAPVAALVEVLREVGRELAAARGG